MLEWVRFGSGPPLVAVHALAFSKRYFVESNLGDAFDVIAVDQRGHGDSDAIPPSATLQELALELDAVLDEAGVAEATFAGISLGAALTISYTLQRPERVSALIQDLPAFAPHSAMSPSTAGAIADALRANDQAAALKQIGTKALTRIIASHWKDLPKLAGAFDGIQRWQVTDRWPEDLRAIEVPVHILALKGDRAHPYAVAEEMHAAIAGSTLGARPPTLDARRALASWAKLRGVDGSGLDGL